MMLARSVLSSALWGFLFLCPAFATEVAEDVPSFLPKSNLRAPPSAASIVEEHMMASYGDKTLQVANLPPEEQLDVADTLKDSMIDVLSDLDEVDTSDLKDLEILSEMGRKYSHQAITTLEDAVSTVRSILLGNAEEHQTDFARRLNEAHDDDAGSEDSHTSGQQQRKRAQQNHFGGFGFHGQSFNQQAYTSHYARRLDRMREAIYNGDHHAAFSHATGRHQSSLKNDSKGRRLAANQARRLTKKEQCELLVDCTLGMSRYDTFVFFFSDDIDPATGNVDSNLLKFNERDLYTYYDKIQETASEIKDSADYSGESCSELLQMFHRTVEEGRAPHWESASVTQVCLAEGTTAFVKFSEMANALVDKSFPDGYTQDSFNKFKDDKKKALEWVLKDVAVEPFQCAEDLFYNGRPNNQDKEEFPFGGCGGNKDCKIEDYKFPVEYDVATEETGRAAKYVKSNDEDDLRCVGSLEGIETEEECIQAGQQAGGKLTNGRILGPESAASSFSKASKVLREVYGQHQHWPMVFRHMSHKFYWEPIGCSINGRGQITWNPTGHTRDDYEVLLDKLNKDIQDEGRNLWHAGSNGRDGECVFYLVCKEDLYQGDGAPNRDAHGKLLNNDKSGFGSLPYSRYQEKEKACLHEKSQNADKDCLSDADNQKNIKYYKCLVKKEEEALEECDAFGPVQTALAMVFGNQASPGFICGIADAVVNDGVEMPGTCCLDVPYELDGDDWGQPFQCSSTCKNPGPFLAGINEDACSAQGGTWCPSRANCKKLKACLASHITDAETEQRLAYKEYLKGAPSIDDPHDDEQCGRTRGYFGFDPLFINDDQICQDVEQLKYSKDFDFLNEFFQQGSDVEAAGGGANGAANVPKLHLSPPDRAKSSLPINQNNVLIGKATQTANHVVSALASLLATLVDSPCPCDPLCGVTLVCQGVKGVLYVIFRVMLEAARMAVQIVEGIFSIDSISPDILKDQENTAVIFDNMESTGDYLYEMRLEINELGRRRLLEDGDIDHLDEKLNETKAEIQSLKAELESNQNETKAEIQSQIQSLKAGLESNQNETKAEIQSLKLEVQAAVEEMMKKQQEELEATMKQQQEDLKKQQEEMKRELLAAVTGVLQDALSAQT